MAKPPNQSSTKEGSVKPKGKAKPAAKPSGYDWGDGRKVHTITLAEHQQNRQGVADYGVTPSTPLDQPLTAGQAYALAQATAGRTYNPQIDANRQLQTNVPAWYQNYVDQTGKQQAAAQAYAQPILATAQSAVTNAQQTAPGLDPSSPQYAKEQQAAQGRGTMAQDSANYLAGVAAATDAYFGGQANTAQRELPQVQAGLLAQYGQLQGQKQDAASAAYGDIRTNEQNAAIARQTLGLNAADSAANVDLKRGVDPVTGKPLPKDAVTGYAPGGPGQNKYGYTYDEWSKLSPKARDKARAGNGTAGKTQAQKDAEKQAAADAKKKTAIQKATGAVKTKITDARTAWDRYARASNPVIDPKTKLPIPGKTVKATPDQIKAQLRKDGYTETEIHVMLMLRGGKTLTQAEVDALKGQDPNIRIPREWLKGKQAALNTPNRAPAPKNDKSGMGNRPN